jgi:segregation and condensation protein A
VKKSQALLAPVDRQMPANESLGPKPHTARVRGELLETLPEDLYIPPGALEVFLEAFEGPLDLLMYLIRRHNLDILDIPIALITRQYMDYIAMLRELRFELAAEYLLMAAILAEIKSRMLLPKPAASEDEGEDPRAELIRRLQEYERFRRAAEDLDTLPRLERELHVAQVMCDHIEVPRPLPQVQLQDMLLAMADVMARVERFSHHTIQREQLSVRERMSNVLARIAESRRAEFTTLLRPEEGRMGVVVTLLAILELAREQLLVLTQNEAFGPIYLSAK